MGFLEILLIAISLSMDAFAVSVCKGLSMKTINKKEMLLIGIYFSVFQMIMPFFGYFMGSYFSSLVDKIDHFIVFILLSIISFGMIKSSFSNEENRIKEGASFKSMFVLAIATSIDALAIGVTFAFLEVNLILSISTIGIICFLLSILGVFIGYKFGNDYEKKASLFGGIILFLIGLKILLDHLGLF